MGPLAGAPLRTVVVGGGPGGLFYALLAKQRFPQHAVHVYERNPRGATFGFGVVFSERTLGGFADADPALHAAMAGAGVQWGDIEVRRRDGVLRCGGHGFSAISRKTLLGLMQERAEAVGVELHFEHEAGPAELRGADLVVAADGVNSGLRDPEGFRPAFDEGAARFIWFGTPQPFDALTFVFAENEHGQWGLHAYPYEDGTSTFILETDADTWRRAGLDRAGDLAPGESDARSRAYCEALYADTLGGHGLLENNSRWLSFRTLRCGAWTHGNVALVGDAAHTAHFSVGSGTKMAMEDAVALADAVGAADDVPAAFAAYEAERRPQVERIQAASHPSIVWWERFRHLRDRPLEQFAFHFLSRSPIVTRDRLVGRDFGFVRRVDRWAQEALGGPPLAAPLTLGGVELPSRLVVAPDLEPDPVIALAAPALSGAGLVIAPAPEHIAWIQAHTPAAAAVEVGTPDAIAAALGADVLVAPLGLDLEAWPADRPVLLRVEAPADAEGPEADALLGQLAAAGREHLVVIAVGGDDAVEQLLLCDRVVEELGLRCCLVGAARDHDAATTAILAGRVHLVEGRPSLVSTRWAASRAAVTA